MLSPCAAAAFQSRPNKAPLPGDWVCPMDPDVRSDKPGVCPRCGMKLVLQLPDPVEYTLEGQTTPHLVQPRQQVEITFQIRDPRTGQLTQKFDVVHEKLLHLFLVSENLEFFAHVHPEIQPDCSFKLTTRFPHGGMYRILTDYYPSGALPQLTLGTLYVAGSAPKASLKPNRRHHGPRISQPHFQAIRLNLSRG